MIYKVLYIKNMGVVRFTTESDDYADKNDFMK